MDEWPAGSVMAGLALAERDALLHGGTLVNFPPDEALMRQGEVGTELFVILAGFAKVLVLTPAGVETIMALRGRGEVVGEFALIDGSPRSATVVALTAMRAVRIGRNRFAEICQLHPGIVPAITQNLVAKIRTATDHRASHRGHSARARIARLLVGLAEREPFLDAAGPVTLPITQADLGALASTADSTVERVLGDLRQRGLVSTGYRHITLHDLAALSKIAGGDSPI